MQPLIPLAIRGLVGINDIADKTTIAKIRVTLPPQPILAYTEITNLVEINRSTAIIINMLNYSSDPDSAIS